MQFFFRENTPATREHETQYDAVIFDCARYSCGSENTIETHILVPSGKHYKVLCENGHLTNGIPPRRFRNTTRIDVGSHD